MLKNTYIYRITVETKKQTYTFTQTRKCLLVNKADKLIDKWVKETFVGDEVVKTVSTKLIGINEHKFDY